MPFVVSQNRSIYYERHGQGPALVLLHGAGSNAATWWQQLPLLSAHFTCYTMDIRCFGRSVAPPDELQIPLMVQDLLAMLDQEGVQKAALLGQSLGGMVGLRAAVHHPDRVAALVACDTSLAVDHPDQLALLDKRITAVAAMSIEQRSLGRWFIENRPDLVALYAQINHFNPSTHSVPPAQWRAAMQGLNQPHNLVPMAALNTLACPVLVVVGRDDPIVPQAFVDDVVARVPDVALCVVENAAHSAYFEQAAVFNERVLAFLLERHR